MNLKDKWTLMKASLNNKEVFNTFDQSAKEEPMEQPMEEEQDDSEDAPQEEPNEPESNEPSKSESIIIEALKDEGYSDEEIDYIIKGSELPVLRNEDDGEGQDGQDSQAQPENNIEAKDQNETDEDGQEDQEDQEDGQEDEHPLSNFYYKALQDLHNHHMKSLKNKQVDNG